MESTLALPPADIVGTRVARDCQEPPDDGPGPGEPPKTQEGAGVGLLNEVLVLGELLDRTVTVVEGGAQAHIVDAGMEQNRARDWVITRLALRTSGGRIGRRRGQLFQAAWNEVDGLGITETRQGTDTLLSMLSDLRAADVANALRDMPDKRRLEVASALDDERQLAGREPVLDRVCRLGEQALVLVGEPDPQLERRAVVLDALADDLRVESVRRQAVAELLVQSGARQLDENRLGHGARIPVRGRSQPLARNPIRGEWA